MSITITISLHKIVVIAFIAALVLLNLLNTFTPYANDYEYGSTIPYPPPYKLFTRISIYNVVENETVLFKVFGLISGFTLSQQQEASKYSVVSVSGEGPELLVLSTSILLFIYYVIGSKLYGKSRKYYVLVLMLLIIIVLLYLYTLLYSIQYSIAKIVELKEPISCTIAYNQRVCLLDVVKNKSITFIYVNGSARILFIEDDVVVKEVNVGMDKEFRYATVFGDEHEYRIVLLSSPRENYTLSYRRIYFVKTSALQPQLLLYIISLIMAMIIIIPLYLIHVLKSV